MFKTFTFKSLASLALILAVTSVGAADTASARKKKPMEPGYWQRSEDGGFEWSGPKSTRPRGGVEPTVRDHRGEDLGGGGVTVFDGPGREQPKIRDHRVKPKITDHRRKKKIFGMPVRN